MVKYYSAVNLLPDDLVFLSIMLIIKSISIVERVPRIAPAIMSVGKCTKRNILEKPMRTASTYAAHPAFLFHKKIARAAANDEDVCPDGNENSSGLGMSIGTVVKMLQGLTRPTRFLITNSPVIRQKAMDAREIRPNFLDFLKHSIITEISIQINPFSPR